MTALLIACTLGLPLGAFLAVRRFSGRKILIGIINTLMGMPRLWSGWLSICICPFRAIGVDGLTLTPTAMIIAQVILITPIIVALAVRLLKTCTKITAIYSPHYVCRAILLYSATYMMRAIRCSHCAGRVWPGCIEVGAVIVVGDDDH